MKVTMSTLLWHNELNNKQIYDDVEKFIINTTMAIIITTMMEQSYLYISLSPPSSSSSSPSS
jgi:hypothetical protein